MRLGAKIEMLMRIWLINPYGPIPGENWRDYRFTMLGEALSKAGHETIWWTSSFSHHFKTFRSKNWEDRKINDLFSLRLVPTPGYKKNIGLGRIIRDAVFAWRTYRKGRRMAAPDLIFYGDSPLCFGYAGQKLGAFHRVPVVFDQMDLWPELFEPAFPGFLRPLAHHLLAPIYWSRRSVYAKLSGVVALAKAYLEVPLREAPELNGRPHGVFYNGIDVIGFRALMQAPVLAGNSWPSKGEGDVWAIFAGSLGPSYDIQAILQSAEQLKTAVPQLKVLIAGDGPQRPDVEMAAAKTGSNVHYLGKLTPNDLCKIYNNCDIGLNAYSKISNVEMSDKFYDYTAAGLAIINSLQGEVGIHVSNYNLGLQYEGGNVASLSHALSTLATQTQQRLSMAQNSHDVAIKFDRYVQYNALVDFLKQFDSK